MARPEIPLRGGLEQDALTGWRKFLAWKAGQRKWVKRMFRKRARRVARRDIDPDKIDFERFHAGFSKDEWI